MPPVPQEFSDEYVADLMKNDARESSIKYSALGLEAFRPKRQFGAGPKPNTRFLANLLKETDSHNTALLEKEQREARDRQRALARNGDQARQKDRCRVLERFRDYEESQRKRKREEGHRDSDGVERSRKRRSRSRSRSPYTSARAGERDSRRDRSRSGSDFERDSSHRHRHSKRRRSYSRSPDDKRDRRNDWYRRNRERPRPRDRPDRRDDRGDHVDSGRHKERHRDRTRSRSPAKAGIKSSNDTHNSNHEPIPSLEASDSDPLEELLGPAPPPKLPEVRVRGRGAAVSSISAMDTRFKSSYDPTTDVQPDPDTEDDWEMALEAMRDRQKWKQQGADRLRAAGFSDAEVKKWEKGGTKDESDVRWAKHGEGREWDRGKVVDDEGTVDLKPEWGRLKDN